MEPIPVVKEKRGISPVWTLPIIALLICAWIVFSSYRNAGITISIYFEDASGITPGKTQVVARGIPIGTVSKIIPDIANRRIETIVEMDKSIEKHLVEDTVFWVVRPEISGASVKGLDTLFSGSYIGFQAGSSKNASRTFSGLSSPPAIAMDTPGLHVMLSAEAMGSIQIGSEVYYRNIPIGLVTNTSLNRNDNTVMINVFIKPEYSHLVKEGSRFSNASGLSISGKLTKLKVHIESLSALLKGGIVLHTPAALQETKQVSDGHIFPLYKDLESGRFGIKMTLQLASSFGITEGETQLIYRGLVAGVVEKIEFNDDERHTVTAHIALDPRAERVLRKGSKFWIVKPEISTERIVNLNTLLTGSYITFIPGDGPYQDHFEILPEPPPQTPLRPGKEILLTSAKSYSLQKGAPLYYKSKKVGEVLDIDISENSKDFDILAFVYQKYEHFVQPNSVFWSDGGISFDASLSGIQLKADSLSAVFNGGIAFLTPDIPATKNIKDLANIKFTVHENLQEAQAASPQIRPPGYRFQIKTATPESYKPGTPIRYKNIRVGEIVGFRLSKDNRFVLIDGLIEPEYADTINSSTRFYDMAGVAIHGSLSGVEVSAGPIDSIISGGISYFTPNHKAKKPKSKIFELFPSQKAAEAQDYLEMTVRFKECDNLRPGAAVTYKGVRVGEVASLDFAENMRDILVSLHVEKKAEHFFRTDTRIWLEHTKASFSGVKNLKNVLFGSYIKILPGTGKLNRDFLGLAHAPSTPIEIDGGLHLILSAKHLGSIKINSPIYYRQIKVGKVINFSLSEDFKNVHISINIEEPYMPIIRENTKFWIASGARIEGGLFSGVSVKMESLEALLSGGIALATPGETEMGKRVGNNHLFTLHDEAMAEWLDWQPTIRLVDEEEVRKDI